MKLFTPFTIPKENDCDLFRIKTNKRRQIEKNFVDQLFKFTYIDTVDFVFDSTSNRRKQHKRRIDFF